MFAQVQNPQVLTPQDLDGYLARGWFRMGQTIFTTNFLSFNDQLYSAIWLRVVLDDFKPTKTQQKLVKLNASFKPEIKQANVTQEQETLFEKYKRGVSFEASPSLNSLLYGKSFHNIYNTYEIEIYDGNKLIAVGFFDIGEKSAAGITSFYDPAYKKYSLGNYLMFLKMEYGKSLGLDYFYPGYFVPGYSFFDYKLRINNSNLQYWQLNAKRWLPIESFSHHLNPVQLMYDKLYALQARLAQSKIGSKVLRYVFYDANLFPDFIDAELFDFPLFLYCFKLADDQIHPVVVFDIEYQMYRLVSCKQVWKSNLPDNINETYSSYLLKIDKDLFSTDDAGEMASSMLNFTNNPFITLTESPAN